MKNTEIDWSKAPEGATHWDPETDAVWASWMKVSPEGTWYYWPPVGMDNPSWVCSHVSAAQIDAMIARPTTPEPQTWNGEGLPPVGTVCLVSGQGANEYWARHADKEAMIIAHDINRGGDECAVYSVLDSDGYKEYHALIGECFRPTRTPEQLAAEERTRAINEMRRACPYPGSSCTLVDCEALYDAGYRKTAED
jgi:hypothetical protein